MISQTDRTGCIFTCVVGADAVPPAFSTANRFNLGGLMASARHFAKRR